MDFDKVLSSIVTWIITTFIAALVFQIGIGALDVNGEPSNWEIWNGYTAGGSFLISNYDGEFGKIDENEVGISNDDCEPDMNGFSGENSFLEFDSSVQNCGSVLGGANITVLSTSQDVSYTIRVDGDKN